MTNSDARSPFVVRDYFLETAFELRFQGLLRVAKSHLACHCRAARQREITGNRRLAPTE